jgi:hypothetical protein
MISSLLIRFRDPEIGLGWQIPGHGPHKDDFVEPHLSSGGHLPASGWPTRLFAYNVGRLK